MKTRTIIAAAVVAASIASIGTYVWAQQGHGFGPGRMDMGPGSMMEMGPGMPAMMGGSATVSEMQELHQMFVEHDKIKRTVANLPNGIRTVTESEDPEMARILVSHVAGMMKRVEEGRNPRLPMQSPQLEIIFRNRDKIKTSIEPTPKGIAVTQTSDDAETVAALQKHAEDVSDSVRRGMVAAHETMMRNMDGAMSDHMMHHGPGQNHSPPR